MNIKNISSKIKFLTLFLTNITIFVNYLFFIIFLLFYAALDIWNTKNKTKFETLLLKIIPINYYSFSFFTTFNENSKSSIFWDMQNFLHYLKCNSGESEYSYRFLGEILPCPETIGYGLMTEYILISSLDIWESTLTISIIFLLTCLLYILFSQNNIMIKIVILVSPGFHFLIYSLNTDIFVLLFIFYILKKSTEFEYIFKLLMLSIITQIKSYTAFIFLGLLGKSMHLKKYGTAKIEIMFIFINFSLIIFHYFINKSLLPEPISFTRSFGVLHDYKLLTEYIGFDEAMFLILFTIFIVLLYRKKIINFVNRIDLTNNNIKNKLTILMPLCLFINLYQNWGYKFVFNSLVIYLLFESTKNQYFKFYLLLVNLSATTYYSIGWGFENNLLNLIIISISKFTFYSYFFLMVLVCYRLYKKLFMINNWYPLFRNIGNSDV